ncbi:MAG: hypothetical protein HND51_21545 [Chloroflexi bacterium]|nr:hypothetical protein [Chloroflexota bacterium]
MKKDLYDPLEHDRIRRYLKWSIILLVIVALVIAGLFLFTEMELNACTQQLESLSRSCSP